MHEKYIKFFLKFLIGFAIVCLIKAITEPSFKTWLLADVSIFIYIQQKYIKKTSTYNAITFLIAGITLIISYTISIQAFSIVLAIYTTFIAMFIFAKTQKYINNK